MQDEHAGGNSDGAQRVDKDAISEDIYGRILEVQSNAFDQHTAAQVSGSKLRNDLRSARKAHLLKAAVALPLAGRDEKTASNIADAERAIIENHVFPVEGTQTPPAVFAHHGSPHDESDLLPFHFLRAKVRNNSKLFSASLKVDERRDGSFVFYGHPSYTLDDNHRFSVEVTSTFFAKGATWLGRGNYFFGDSEPTIDLTGNINGYTGFFHWLVAADDKWCRCKLALNQRLYYIPSGLGHTPITVASRTEWLSAIDEENKGRQVRYSLPGQIRMPALRVKKVIPGYLYADLTVTVEVEMEGLSKLWFGPYSDQSTGGVRLQFNQWDFVGLS